MQQLHFNLNHENRERHTCIGHQEGDWIIFTCPQCKNYERRVNWKTGEMLSRVGENEILHSGFHAPVEILDVNQNGN